MRWPTHRGRDRKGKKYEKGARPNINRGRYFRSKSGAEGGKGKGFGSGKQWKWIQFDFVVLESYAELVILRMDSYTERSRPA